ncbi:MAG: FAD-dependent oxidoreductase, partial [Actinomycetes bacterium]
MRVVVLGAGFGGLEVTTAVAEELGPAADITLIDQTESFVFGFSKLDVMFGHADAGGVLHRYADIAKPGVRFVQSLVQAIDPVARSVQTDAGTFEADVLVVALGADLDPAATPGLVEAGHEFYTEAGAFGLRETLTSFKGGNVIVGVTSAPFKCPPAPSECALLTHELLTRLGVRDQSTL